LKSHGNGVDLKGRKGREEDPGIFFSEKQPLRPWRPLRFKVFAIAVSVAVQSAIRNPQSAIAFMLHVSHRDLR
jgi:hypothetical protein